MSELLIKKQELSPLSGLWLTRKSLVGDGIDHFSSVMDCEERSEAEALAFAAGKRFNGDYIEARRCVELWLRQEGEKKGLRPTSDSPLYFRLYSQPFATKKDGWTFLNVPGESVPADKITFTIEDSFHNYAQLMGWPTPDGLADLEPRVANASEICSILDVRGFPEHLDGRDVTRYIEAQVWSRDLPIFEHVKNLVGTKMHEDNIVVIDFASIT